MHGKSTCWSQKRPMVWNPCCQRIHLIPWFTSWRPYSHNAKWSSRQLHHHKPAYVANGFSYGFQWHSRL
jgi:hypothetical protein